MSEIVLHGIFGDSGHLLHITVELLHFSFVALHFLVVQELTGGRILGRGREKKESIIVSTIFSYTLHGTRQSVRIRGAASTGPGRVCRIIVTVLIRPTLRPWNCFGGL